MTHPQSMTRDTALYKPLRPAGQERKTPSLAHLSEVWLHQTIRQVWPRKGQNTWVGGFLESFRWPISMGQVCNGSGGKSPRDPNIGTFGPMIVAYSSRHDISERNEKNAIMI